jgi:PHD/YefM family antitoxin component YafN of YafNO toxin-antitoxin module
MKAIPLPKELQPFVAFAEAAGEEPLVFTEKRRPVAMLVSLRKVDRESLALSTNPEFLSIIETARQEIRAGKTTSLEEVERKLRRATPNKAAAPDRGPVAVRKKRERPRSGRGQ